MNILSRLTGGSGNEEVKQSSQNNVELLSLFVQTVEDLLNGLHDTFPECDKVYQELLRFRSFVKNPDEKDEKDNVIHKGQIKQKGAEMLIKDWHKDMQQHYESFTARDSHTILNSGIPMIQKLDIQQKWNDPTFEQSDREILFEYIDNLNNYAQLYCCFTPNMLNKMEMIANDLAGKVQRGETDFAQIDIFALGQQIVEGQSEDDLMHLLGNVGQLQKMMQSTVSKMSPEEMKMVHQMQSTMPLMQFASLGARMMPGGGNKKPKHFE